MLLLSLNVALFLTAFLYACYLVLIHRQSAKFWW